MYCIIKLGIDENSNARNSHQSLINCYFNSKSICLYCKEYFKLKSYREFTVNLWLK